MYLLTVSIFSLLGSYIYDDIHYENYINKLPTSNYQFNFDNFYNSLLLCLSTYQGVSWEYLMLEYETVDTTKVSRWLSNFYFILGFFICNTVMMNLFLLTIIMKYDQFHSKEENPILKFTEIFDSFQAAWIKLSVDKGMRIKALALLKLLEETYKNIDDINVDIISEFKKLDTNYLASLDILQ